MLRVIDTIEYSETLLSKYPELMARFGLGLFVILDPKQVSSAPVQAGAIVRIHRPDGVSFDRMVSGVEIRRSVVGLFFMDTAGSEIPKLSEIEVIGGSK